MNVTVLEVSIKSLESFSVTISVEVNDISSLVRRTMLSKHRRRWGNGWCWNGEDSMIRFLSVFGVHVGTDVLMGKR